MASDQTLTMEPDPVAAARGWMALALVAPEAPTAAALAVCAAWDELDQTGSFSQLDPIGPPRTSCRAAVDEARTVLRDAADELPRGFLVVVAAALDHLDEAARLLDSTLDGDPWL